MKKTVTSALALGFALVLSLPPLARAGDDSARTAVQKHNIKQSRRDMKRMQKEQKKAQKASPGKVALKVPRS